MKDNYQKVYETLHFQNFCHIQDVNKIGERFVNSPQIPNTYGLRYRHD